MRVVIRPAARNDQLEIAEYYDHEGGTTLGDRFNNQCFACFSRLEIFPESGAPIRLKHPALKGCRFIVVPQFEKILVFYKVQADGIEIIRILRGSRDIAAVF